MKKSMLFGIVRIMTACLTLSTIQTNAQKKDEDAIKKVIHEETSTYFHKNYDGWADTWAHDSADNVLNTGPYPHQEIAGWNAIYQPNTKKTSKVWR
jgi:CDP-diacylglycerol pyrophosphatase